VAPSVDTTDRYGPVITVGGVGGVSGDFSENRISSTVVIFDAIAIAIVFTAAEALYPHVIVLRHRTDCGDTV